MNPQIDLEKCAPIINRLTYWASLNDAELRLHCGEMTAQEIRTVRAVLAAILPRSKSESQKMGTNDTAGIAARCAVEAGSALMPLGSPCSLYEAYTLRVEVNARGVWMADTNWHESEIDDARARANYLLTSQRRDIKEVRIIRIRFEILPKPQDKPRRDNETNT